jgi:PEP-CTERM/exosortase A-associated glycosyltransferase
MKILHAVHTSLPFICGYSIRSDYILRFQREGGLEPAVVSSAQHPNGEALREEINGVLHWRTPALAGKQPPLLREWRLMRALERELVRAVAEWKPEVLHAHSPMLVGLPALRAARRFGLPLVYEVRDLWENASVDRGKFAEGSPPYRAARSLESYVLRNADAVVTICEKLRDELATRTGRPDRLFVVPNGVDAASFTPGSAPDARSRWGLDGKQVIAYVGTFQPYEGLPLLIAAMRLILERQPQAHLLITGSGGQEEQLRAQVRGEGLEGCVTFTGRLPHNEVAGIYAAADLMVYPRILTRTTALTTPLKPLEAMAMGRAVMVSDVPAMQELVRPGVTGLAFRAGDLSDLAEQCAGALRDPAARERMGEAGREWVLAERQWSQLVSRYRGVYETVLAGKTLGSPLALQEKQPTTSCT